ncbi:MAG: polysaccharide deacetylase family protein [Thermodesulfovibrionales bacterium]
MQGKKTKFGRLPFLISFFMLFVLSMIGCAGTQVAGSQVMTPQGAAPAFPPFVAVTVREGDTLSSLASTHLHDASRAWLIADFNDITTLYPGQMLIIPLKDYESGGLTAKGYQTVPVLSYHKFSNSKADKMTVTASAFEEQMKFLKDKGYRVITLDQLFDFLDFKAQIPKRSVVITIDDGWRSAHEVALPVLKKYGYPATLFVYSELITGSKKTLDWGLVKEMADNGIDIQGHTRTHRSLTTPTERESFKEYFEAIEKELLDDARIIKAKTNIDVKYVAYPFGDTNHLVIALLRKQGYRGGLTVKRDSNAFFVNNFRVNRSMIYGDYDMKQFEKNLTVFSEEALR